MIAVAPGVLLRSLGIEDVLARIQARHSAEIARHNAGIVEQLDLEPTPPRRDQVLELFGPTARRLAR